MADRIHIWHYVLNEEGQPIEDAEVRLYLDSTLATEANIYLTNTSTSSTTCSDADIKTDNDGFVEFWLAGEWETGGYAFTQTFTLEWFKAGTQPGYIYDYNPWPNALIWRDENTSAERNYTNKLVSNYLVKKWLDHVPLLVPSASPHDLAPVDYASGCTNDIYNKVVSNKFLNDIIQNCYASDSITITSSGGNGHSETITSWTVSGSQYYKDITHASVDNDSVVTVIDLTTFKEILPTKIIFTGTNTTRILVEENNNMVVLINGSV